MENRFDLMKILCVAVALVAVMASRGLADDLIPATSEDISQFDAQLARQRDQKGQSADKRTKDKKDNFGQQVSSEAKRLRESGEQKQGFGQWVKSQHEREDQGRPSKAVPNSGNQGTSGGSVGVGKGPGSGGPGAGPGNSGGNGNGHGNGKKK